MIKLILQIITGTVGFIGFIYGITERNSMMLGYGLFLIITMMFIELIRLDNNIKYLKEIVQNKNK